jgi:hypothetical protein
MVVMSVITSFAFRLHSSHEEIPEAIRQHDSPQLLSGSGPVRAA